MARKTSVPHHDSEQMTPLEFINSARRLARDMLPGITLGIYPLDLFGSLPKDLFDYCVAAIGCLESAYCCKSAHLALWTEKKSKFPVRRMIAQQFAALECWLNSCEAPIEKVLPQVRYKVECGQRQFGGVVGESAGMAICKWAAQVYLDVRKDIYPFCTDVQKKEWHESFPAVPDDALVRYGQARSQRSERDDSHARQVSISEIRSALSSIGEETNKVVMARKQKPQRRHVRPTNTPRKPAPVPMEKLRPSARRIWDILLAAKTPMTVDDFQLGHHMGRTTVTDGWKSLEKHGLIVRCEGGGVLPAPQYRNRTETELK